MYVCALLKIFAYELKKLSNVNLFLLFLNYYVKNYKNNLNLKYLITFISFYVIKNEKHKNKVETRQIYDVSLYFFQVNHLFILLN